MASGSCPDAPNPGESIVMPRILAVGDIHGCSRALDLLLADLNPCGDDTIVTLGDYVDRGPDSKGVLDRLIDLGKRVQLVPIRGNHEAMLLSVRLLGDDLYLWLECGGWATLESYGQGGRPGRLDDVPERHWQFLEACPRWFESPTHLFVHAGAFPEMKLDEQPDDILYWEPFCDRGPHCSGKIMVCGHTQQRSGVPLNMGHAVCIDTWAYGDGWLTGLDVTTGQIWQANQKGDRRTAHLDEYITGGKTQPW
jgi:serine/threonine protein phosphatase 1